MGMRKKTKCIHFNGMSNKCCKAGVNYEELAPGTMLVPCFGLKAREGHELAKCDKFQEPTEEEIEADRKRMEERMEKHRKTGPAIIAMKERHRIPGKGKPRFKSGTEKMPCPACGTGELHVAISGYNGHTQGQCSTTGCVSWIE